MRWRQGSRTRPGWSSTGGGDANEQPLAPSPPQPASPPAVAAEGEGEGDVDVAVDPRHVLRFVSSEGLRVGHTVHQGRQASRLPHKGSLATHSVPDPGVGNGRSTWLRRRSICTKRVQMDGPYNSVTP